jgi:hypothetical protein
MFKHYLMVTLAICFMLIPISLIALEWNLVDEDFDVDGSFGAFDTVEHTGDDRTAEVQNGMAILKRIGDATDIGPTMRAYFDDPGTNEFIMYIKADVKNFGGGHFLLAMRISGFEYLPTVAEDNIGDHESPEQWNSGIRTKEIVVTTTGVHEYLIVGKSADAYDLYYDGNLIIQDGVTRPLGGAAWEVAQAMIHVRKGSDLELHIHTVKVLEGNDNLDQVLAVSPVSSESKLTITWGVIKYNR